MSDDTRRLLVLQAVLAGASTAHRVAAVVGIPVELVGPDLVYWQQQRALLRHHNPDGGPLLLRPTAKGLALWRALRPTASLADIAAADGEKHATPTSLETDEGCAEEAARQDRYD